MIGIIGAGIDGSAIANGLAISGAAEHIVLIDKRASLARAQADDIGRAAALLGGSTVRSGQLEDLADCAICVVAAGSPPHPGETQAEQVARNATIFEEFFGQINRHAPEAVLLIAACPSDQMTMVAQAMAERPTEKVIGCGTILQSARFGALLAQLLDVRPDEICAHVVGGEGDSQLLCWSGVEIDGAPLGDYLEKTGISIARKSLVSIDMDVRRAASRILEGKGSAQYGIAGAVCRIVRAIIGDEKAQLSVTMLEDQVLGIGPVALSLPRIIGATGIVQTIMPAMSESERRALRRSASIALERLPPDWARRGPTPAS